MNDIEDLLSIFDMCNIKHIIDKHSFENLDLSSEVNNIRMATVSSKFAINCELFKLKLGNIKPYDGDCNNLNNLITRCERLIETYSYYNDVEVVTYWKVSKKN